MNYKYNFKNVSDLSKVVDILVDKLGVSINVVAKSKTIITLINYLVSKYNFTIFNVSIDYEDDNYYLMSVDDIGNVWCQKAKNGEKFVELDINEPAIVHKDIDPVFFDSNKNNNNIYFFDITN